MADGRRQSETLINGNTAESKLIEVYYMYMHMWPWSIFKRFSLDKFI